MNKITRSYHSLVGWLFCLCFTALLALVAPHTTPIVQAASITVTGTGSTIAVDGACTLPEAVQAANTNTAVNECAAGSAAETDIITFSGGGIGTIQLGDELMIDTALTIAGPEDNTAVKIQSAASRCFNIQPPDAVNVTLSNLTIENCTTTIFGGAIILNGAGSLTVNNSIIQNNQSGRGGAINNNAGILTLNDSIITGNSSTAGDQIGGGISTGGSASATTINTSTISNNTATLGGGGIYHGGGTLTVNRSTISGNNAPGGTGDGGGISIEPGRTATIVNSTISGNSTVERDGGGIWNGGTATIVNSTIAFNGSATTDNGGGIFAAPGSTTTAMNTIIAGNSATTGADIRNNVTGNSNNLISNNGGITGTIGTGSDILSSTPGLIATLALNGAPTGSPLTHALSPASPALEAGNPATCAASPISGIDQRGVARPAGSCAIGAVELPPVVVAISRSSANPTSAVVVSYTVTFNQDVIGVDESDFSLTTSGNQASASISAVSGSGAVWTVQVNTAPGVGDITLNLVDDDSISALGVPLGGVGTGDGNFTGQTYNVNRSMTIYLPLVVR